MTAASTNAAPSPLTARRQAGAGAVPAPADQHRRRDGATAAHLAHNQEITGFDSRPCHLLIEADEYTAVAAELRRFVRDRFAAALVAVRNWQPQQP